MSLIKAVIYVLAFLLSLLFLGRFFLYTVPWDGKRPACHAA